MVDDLLLVALGQLLLGAAGLVLHRRRLLLVDDGLDLCQPLLVQLLAVLLPPLHLCRAKQRRSRATGGGAAAVMQCRDAAGATEMLTALQRASARRTTRTSAACASLELLLLGCADLWLSTEPAPARRARTSSSTGELVGCALLPRSAILVSKVVVRCSLGSLGSSLAHGQDRSLPRCTLTMHHHRRARASETSSAPQDAPGDAAATPRLRCRPPSSLSRFASAPFRGKGSATRTRAPSSGGGESAREQGPFCGLVHARVLCNAGARRGAALQGGGTRLSALSQWHHREQQQEEQRGWGQRRATTTTTS